MFCVGTYLKMKLNYECINMLFYKLNPYNRYIFIFLLILNFIVSVEVKSEPEQIIESNQGFLASEMFCADRNYPVPTMSRGDRNYTKDCYKIGSFTNMERLFRYKKILKSKKKYTFDYSKEQNTNSFKNAFSNLIENYPITAIIVAKNNKIVTEYYGYSRNQAQHFASFSIHKSFNAILIGIAHHQNLIKNLDVRAVKYLQELRNSEWASVTIRQLLTMTSGIAAQQRKLIIPLLFGNSEILQVVKNQDSRVAPSGKIFSYNDANTLILGKVIERVFDKPWNKVFEDQIWRRIGAEDNASVLTSESGEVLTNAFFNARPRDYMRLGLLMANDGQNLFGNQVVPISWVNKMLGKGEEFVGCPIGPGENCPGLGPLGYTYQTWRSPTGSAIFFMGKYGQLILIHPASNTVAVILSATKSGRLVHIFTEEMKLFLRELIS